MSFGFCHCEEPSPGFKLHSNPCSWGALLGPAGQTNSAPLAFFSVQNQDGVCVQSVSVILHQDPRRQVTLTQAGDVLLFDQYKVTPPYTDGTALVDASWLPRLLFPGSSGQRHCHTDKSSPSSTESIRPGGTLDPGTWTLDLESGLCATPTWQQAS